jgi:peptide-methionine (S)-S-oxide reductase
MRKGGVGAIALVLLLSGVAQAKSVPKLEHATLGGGCFWCMDAVYEQVRGVTQVDSGYAGGHVPDPSYEQVCAGGTGHAEVVQLTFDPAVVSYRDLLRIFFTVHDPTSVNRQGADVGAQYRSIILTEGPAQAQTSRSVISELNAAHLFNRPIVTEVVPLTGFYRAEEYHQNYFARHPSQPYCVFVVAPKVQKFRDHFLAKLKK